MIKFLPNIKEGIKFIGFLHPLDEKKLEESYYVIFDTENGSVLGLS